MSPLPVIAVVAAFVFADEGDDLRIQCGDCEQTEKISLPACLDGAKAAPAAEVSGHRLTLDQDGRKTQVLIGLRDKGRAQQLYFAHRPDGARDWRCTAVTGIDSFVASLAEPGANLSSVGLSSGAPGVGLSLFAQDSCTSQSQDFGIACPALAEGCEVLWQGPFGTSLRGQCDDDSDPKQKKKERQKEAAERKTRARAGKLHAQGMTAFRRGDLAAAEQAWKAAAPDSVAAINDLGFQYHQQKRYPEAERALLQTLLRDGARTPAWLNIADVYWDAGKKGLARRAYGEYTRLAARENKKSAIPPRVVERSK
jgi:hypothetical protein